ncbi:MAG: type II secretion system F family protein [Candidatus Micrarchaeota archaeon]|nr:type II secretion system F family protein [Candidatus Micrarchaeota archaeon]
MNPFERYQKLWAEMLFYNDIRFDGRKFSSLLFFVSGDFALLVLILLHFGGQPSLYSFLGGGLTFLGLHLLVYSYLRLNSSNRAAKVEEVLADFLAIVSSNIRSGLTPDKALLVSVRDEFGPLATEIERASKSSLTGKSLEAIITDIGGHIQSNVLEKTIRLITEGIQSGGDVAELLEKTALDLRKFRSVRREINSIILNYVLFIVAAITFGAPMLFGISTFLVTIMLQIKKNIAAAGSSSMSGLSSQVGLFKGQLLLTADGVTAFAAAAILITVFFGCMAIGVMYSGKRMEGMKYFPMLALLSLGVLFFVRAALGLLLGSMIGGGTA